MNRSTIATILKEKQKISNYVENAGSVKSVIISKKRHVALEKMEQCLITWIQDLNRKNQRLSTPMIKQKAISLYEHITKDLRQAPEDIYDFKASAGWFANFKQRINMKNIKACGESADADHDAAADYPGIKACGESADADHDAAADYPGTLAALIEEEVGSALAAINANEILTLEEYWKTFTIFNAVQNIGFCWDEIKNTTMRRCWKKLCPQFFTDVEANAINDGNINQEIIELAHKMNIKMEADKIEELIESHDSELSNQELIEELIESHDSELSNQELLQIHDEVGKEADEIQKTESDSNAPTKDLTLQMIGNCLNQIENALEALQENDPTPNDWELLKPN
ncbi:Tc5 transposase DNA-binding domain [Popillia japonica]|uniref:Tc5 transposase DNA-binding domain n=1 Tax=Popillia japonica TaxID=7064 RepID=A0AAW1L4S2_POPJA